MGGNINNGDGVLTGRVPCDVSNIGTADAEVRQLPFAEAFKLSDRLTVGEPSLNLF